MLTVEQIRRHLAGLTYLPGWHLELHEGGDAAQAPAHPPVEFGVRLRVQHDDCRDCRYIAEMRAKRAGLG